MLTALRALAWVVLLSVLGGMAAGFGSGLLTRPCAELAGGPARYDMAVVLSAGGERGGVLEAQSRQRTEAAVDLHEAGVVARLHFTGDATRDPDTSAADAMRRLAMAEGVPGTAITVETASRSTLENALFSRPVTSGAESLLLVSTGYHLWRGAASMAWAGTPVQGTCAAGTFGGAPLYRAWYEAVRWPTNAARALAWSAADLAGMTDSLPDWWLE